MHYRFASLALAMILTASALAWEKPADKAAILPTDPKEALAAASFLEKVYAGKQQPEAVRMLIAIVRGSRLAPGEGWFGPAQTRYTWAWLAKQQGTKEKAIPAKAFRGPADLFARLDRDGDGRITPDDFDWADSSPYMRQMAIASRVATLINTKKDGKITEKEWMEFFKKAARGKDHFTPEDLRSVLFPPMPAMMGGDGPSREVLVRGLFAGEIGSLNEGPALDEPAPDFTLKTPDGKETVRLSKLVGPKPIVLVFGNYTCGPFRTTALRVEELHQKYKDKATFVGVYVREAHPTDGWAMMSNFFAGIMVKQPKTYEERAAVCTKFCDVVKPSMPYLVDGINDPAGNAYSGMPGRLYVIDPRGKVAYKSGRGPFGFKVGELEQALLMSLLEFAPPEKKEPVGKP